MPDLDRLCLGRFCGLQLGSNEAAPPDTKRQEHAVQQVRHIDSYCLVLLQHDVVACACDPVVTAWYNALARHSPLPECSGTNTASCCLYSIPQLRGSMSHKDPVTVPAGRRDRPAVR